MANSRDSVVDYLRLPEGNISDVFWILGAFLVLLLGALLLRRWLVSGRRLSVDTLLSGDMRLSEHRRELGVVEKNGGNHETDTDDCLAVVLDRCRVR